MTVNKRLYGLMLCVGMALAIGMTGSADAQAAPSAGAAATAGGDDLPEVVVTARRVEERLQDVPISISVFNQQQLDNRNITTASDLGLYTPSLTADTRFGSANATFAIRGFTQEIRTTPSVGVYFADVVMPRGGGTLVPAGDGAGPGSTFDLQNVQILKGPQGTLFGRNTTGGAILLVPQKPTDEFGGYAEVSVGNYNLQRYQGVINIPLSSSVRLRAGIDRETRDGYLQNISGIPPSRFNDVDYTAGRLSLDADITANLENYTIASYTESDTAGALAQVFACNPHPILNAYVALTLCPLQLARQQGADPFAVQNSYPYARNTAEQWQVINNLTWRATDLLTVKNINSYAEYRSTTKSSFFGDNLIYPASAGQFAGLPLTLTNSNPPPGYPTNDESTITEELQFQGRTSEDKLNWQGGGYFEVSNPLHPVSSLSANDLTCQDQSAQQCTDTLGFINSAATGPLVGRGTVVGGEARDIADIRFRNVGAYFQDTYALTNQLKLTTGVRYTWDRTDAHGQQIVYTFSTPLTSPPYLAATPPTARCEDPAANPATANDPVNGCKLHFGQSSNKPTWVVDLDYAPNQDFMAYAKYARGYRQGGVVPVAPAGASTYGPETVDTYELGTKMSFHGVVRGTFNAAIFYNDFRNQQLQIAFFPVNDPGVAPTTGIQSGATSRIYGAEIDSSVWFTKAFRLDVSGAYLNSKLQTLPAVPLLQGASFLVIDTAQVGAELPFTPRYKASVTGSYTLPIPDAYGPVSVAATYTYTGSMLTSSLVTTPYGIVDATNLLNLNLNWSSIFGKPFDLALFATNVTNVKYTTYVPGYWEGFGLEVRNLGEPQMYGLRLRYHW
jgi:iron complex outermembrane receptor protein